MHEMTLYDLILKHEMEKTRSFLTKAKKESVIIRQHMVFLETRYVSSEIKKTILLLDAAYRRSELGDQDIDHIIEQFHELDLVISRGKSYPGRILDAKKAWVREKVDFYRQLLKIDAVCDTYEDAVRIQFSDEKTYRAALRPILNAERRMNPKDKRDDYAAVQFRNAAQKAEKEVFQEELRYLYPNKK